MVSKSKKLRNMTEGSISRHLISFAMPLCLGNFLQQFYNMVDRWVVGQYVSEAALAAVGMSVPVVHMLTAMFVGIGTGTTVVVAQYYGAGMPERVRSVVSTVYSVFMVAVIPFTLLALLGTKPLLILLRVQSDAWKDAYLYLMITCGGLISVIGYNINNGILQGVGNSRASLLFLGISSVMNIVLDLVFVLVFRWGVAGVAIATIFAQLCSWLVGIVYINRTYPQFAIRPFHIHIYRVLLRPILSIGLPAGFQTAAASIGAIAVMSQINAFGTVYTAGYSIGHMLDNLVALPMLAIAAAATTFTSQNVGAAQPERVRRGIYLSIAYVIGWCFFAVLLLYPGRFAVIGLFTDSSEVIDTAALMMKCLLPLYPLFAVQFTLCSVMRGARESVVPMVITITGQVFVRVLAVYLLAHFCGPNYMYYGFGAGWAFGCVATIIYFATGHWKRHGSLAG